jgi:hypothetical protein
MESLGAEFMTRGVDFSRLTFGETEMLNTFVDVVGSILSDLGAHMMNTGGSGQRNEALLA